MWIRRVTNSGAVMFWYFVEFDGDFVNFDLMLMAWIYDIDVVKWK